MKQADDRQDPGKYVSPVGGHVQAGESGDDALIRECQEECGLTPDGFEFVGQTIYNREVIGRKENHLFLVYTIHTDQDPVLNHESAGYKWFSVAQIQTELKTNPQTLGAAWNYVFKNVFPEIYSF